MLTHYNCIANANTFTTNRSDLMRTGSGLRQIEPIWCQNPFVCSKSSRFKADYGRSASNRTDLLRPVNIRAQIGSMC